MYVGIREFLEGFQTKQRDESGKVKCAQVREMKDK